LDWIGSGFSGNFVDWIGLGQQKWTHVQLWSVLLFMMLLTVWQ